MFRVVYFIPGGQGYPHSLWYKNQAELDAARTGCVQ